MKMASQPNLKLSTTGKVLVAITLASLGHTVYAQNIQAVGGTTVSQKGKVDVVNIVAPNSQGLSHNKYNKYDVSKDGAVLNNSLKAGTSALAGSLNANPHLRDQAAKVILNEVVSKNPSLILGKQEVFGMAADYVLANPNGITYNGGAIINAPRSSLVVGKAEIENGKIKTLNTTKNSATLTVNGKVDNVEVLDLIAPKVVVNNKANLTAKQAVNVVSGSNKVDYQTGKIEAVEPNAKSAVLDGQVFGSMKAGSIRIHSTDKRATQRVEHGNLQADELSLNIAGNAHVKASKLVGNHVVIEAQNTQIDGKITKKNSKNINHSNENGVAVFAHQTANNESYRATTINAKQSISLNNRGTLNVKGAEIITENLSVRGGNVNLQGERTTENTMSRTNRQKGQWHNTQISSERNETLHTTKINAKGDVSVTASGAINLSGSQIQVGKNATIQGKSNVKLAGETTKDHQKTRVDFRNETAALKTGSSSKEVNTQHFHATQLQVGGDLTVKSAETLDVSGAKVTVGGSVLNEAKRTTLATATTADKANVNDKLKYWGGIGGGKNGVTTLSDETLHGTSITAEGKVIFNTQQGVNVKGSIVKGKEGAFINAGSGKANIQNAVATDHNRDQQRVGTIFNITKKRSETESIVQTSTGSELRSEADLQIRSNREINILGSQVSAAKNIGLQASGNINVASAQTTSQNHNESLNVGGKLSTSGGKDTSTVGIGISVVKKEENNTQLTQNSSAINAGGKLEVNAGKNINVAGSQLSASGDAHLTAQNINTSATHNVNNKQSAQRVTDIGIGITSSNNKGNPTLKVSAGVSSGYNNQNSIVATAQSSQISGQNVNLTAQNGITHQGSVVQAVGSVSQVAKNITHATAQNSTQTDTVSHKGGIAVDVGVDSKNGVNVKVGINGSGGKSQENQSNAVATQIVAGQNVNVSADKAIHDTGTQYQAGGTVALDAENYHNQAAKNTAGKFSKQGGAELSVSVATADSQTFDVNVAAKANYSHENSQSSQAVKGQISGTNVVINAKDKAEIAADIHALDQITVSAQNGITLTQSANTQQSSNVGVKVGVDIGAKIVPAAMVAIPSIGSAVDVNYGKVQINQGVGNSLHAGNGIRLEGGNGVTLQGSELSVANSGNPNQPVNGIQINGDHIQSSAVSSSREETAVNVGLGFNLGASASKLDLNGKVNVKREQEIAQSANQLTASEVSLTANAQGNGLSLNGTNITADNVSLSNTAGNIHLGSVNGSLNKTNVGVGLNLAGGMADQAWKPNTGGANLNVDVARNETHTGSHIQANNVQINTPNDLHLISSSINTNTVSGNVGGNIHAISEQNTTHEVSVNLAASAALPVAKAPAVATPATNAATAINPIIGKIGKVVQTVQQIDTVVQAAKPVIQTAQAGKPVDKTQIDNLIGTSLVLLAQNAGGNPDVQKLATVAQEFNEISKVLTPVVNAATNPATPLTAKQATVMIDSLIDKSLTLLANNAGENQEVKKVTKLAQDLHSVTKLLTPAINTAVDPANNQLTAKQVTAMIDNVVSTSLSVLAQNAGDNADAKKVSEVAKQLHDAYKTLTPAVNLAIDPANNKLATAQITAMVNGLFGASLNVVASNAGDNVALQKLSSVAKELHKVSSTLAPVVNVAVDPTNNKLTATQIGAIFDTGLEIGSKVVPPKNPAIVESIRKDIANGTIMGVTASAEAGVKVNNAQVSQATGIIAENDQLNVGGNVIANVNQDSSLKVDVGGKLTSNLAENIAMGVQHLQTGKSPYKAEVSKKAEKVVTTPIKVTNQNTAKKANNTSAKRAVTKQRQRAVSATARRQPR